ncbi:hypothetical protein AB0764_06945 [Priestia megaterium]
MTDFLSDFLSSLGPIVDTPRPLNTRKTYFVAKTAALVQKRL